MPQGAASGPASPERGRAVCSDPDRAAAAPRGALALCPTDAKPALTLEPVRGAHAPRSAPAPRRPATGERRMMPRDTALRRKGPATIPRPLGAPPAIPEREASASGGWILCESACGPFRTNTLETEARSAQVRAAGRSRGTPGPARHLDSGDGHTNHTEPQPRTRGQLGEPGRSAGLVRVGGLLH